MGGKKRIRRPEYPMTYEQFLVEIKNYTNEDIQELGYPTLELFRLELELEQIVTTWQQTNESSLLACYHGKFTEMILKGYDLDHLPKDAQLPIILMPSYPPMLVRIAILYEYKKLWSKVDK
jgi:hypothetical protein